MKQIFKSGLWYVEYTLDDGGRLDRLSYNNFDLVTVEPATFKAPSADYGKYNPQDFI